MVPNKSQLIHNCAPNAGQYSSPWAMCVPQPIVIWGKVDNKHCDGSGAGAWASMLAAKWTVEMCGCQVEVFWVVTPCSVVVRYQRFRGPCCLHLQGEVARMAENSISIGLDGVTIQKISTWSITILKSSKLTNMF